MLSSLHPSFFVALEGFAYYIGLICSKQDQKEDLVANEEADLLTVSEVAKQLRVDDTTVRRWIKSGVLEAITLPHSGVRQAYRIRRATLDALLAAPPSSSNE